MKYLFAIATLSVLATAQAQDGPRFANWKSCSTGTPLYKDWFRGPSVYPMPFCPQNQPDFATDYIYTMYGNVTEPLVQGTKLKISAKVGGKLVYSDTQDYCSLLNVQAQKCPVPANQLVYLYTRPPRRADMPLEGEVDYKYQAFTPDGREMFCWTATLSGPKCTPKPTPTTTTTTAAPTSTWVPPPLYPVSQNCVTYQTDQNVTDFNLTPSDYCIGKPYTITTTGPLLNDIIQPAKLTISGKYLGRIVYTDNYDLCAILAAAGTPCPVAKTATSLSFSVTVKPSLPANIPFAYTFIANNGNNNVLFCRSTNLMGKNCTA